MTKIIQLPNSLFAEEKMHLYWFVVLGIPVTCATVVLQSYANIANSGTVRIHFRFIRSFPTTAIAIFITKYCYDSPQKERKKER